MAHDGQELIGSFCSEVSKNTELPGKTRLPARRRHLYIAMLFFCILGNPVGSFVIVSSIMDASVMDSSVIMAGAHRWQRSGTHWFFGFSSPSFSGAFAILLCC